MNYIAEADSVWYEGNSVSLRVMLQSPILLPIAFPGNPNNIDMIFREDYFDSATRIRRGRLYQKDGKDFWKAKMVSRFPHSNALHSTHIFPVKTAYKAAECPMRAGRTAVLGDNNAQSYWTVVFSEKMGFEAHYLTLKSKTYFGVLPEVNHDAIPEPNRQDILQALDAVVEAAPIQAPQPVIDACRNAACHMISAKFPGSNPNGKKDLGHIVKWLIKVGKIGSCGHAASAIPCLLGVSSGHLINQLHSRAKANAAAQHGTRPVSQQDANLAVDAIAFLLQDFGWAETGT